MRITNFGHLTAMPTPGSEPAAPPAGTADLNSSGISTWLQDNVLGIILLIIGVIILFSARKGDMSKVFVILGVCLVGLAVVAVAVTEGAGVNVGKWVAGLVGINI